MTSQSIHLPQCYCLSQHVLAVPSFSMYGIIIASIKLLDFWLLLSMNWRLLIKRSDVWSKSEGAIKLTKALSFKRGLCSSQDFCQQSRLQRHSPFLLTCHTRNGLNTEAKSFPTKNSFKALPNGKCGAWNTLASILSLSSFTQPAKAVHQTHSFTSILLDRFT